MLENLGEQIDLEFSKGVHWKQQISLIVIYILMSALQPSSIAMVILLPLIC